MLIIKKTSMDGVQVFSPVGAHITEYGKRVIDGNLSEYKLGETFISENKKDFFLQTVFNSSRIIKQIKIVANIDNLRIVGCERPDKCEAIEMILNLNNNNKDINIINLTNNHSYRAYVIDKVKVSDSNIKINEIEFFE